MRRTFSQRSNLCPNHFALLLRKCLKSKALRSGKQTHALLLTSGTDQNVLSLHSKLVGLYASCGDLGSAARVFERIEKPNTFALNWMVLGCAFNGRYSEAMQYIPLMQSSVKHLNEFTFSVLLKMCVGLEDLRKGKQVHCLASVIGLENRVSVANALLDMYCKCRNLVSAREVFDRMPDRNVASWTSMICGYCNAGNIRGGISLFERMKGERMKPNEFTWNTLIAGCARIGESAMALEFFRRMSREGGLVPDLVTWNSMISGFAQSQQFDMALRIFRDMLASGIKPNEVTVTGILPVCEFTGSICHGREIHGMIWRLGLDVDPYVATALIDMYSKCASVKHAKIVFQTTTVKNIATWNVMIGCYGKHGSITAVLKLFKTMKDESVSPNDATFALVLSACSHGGEVERGIEIFRSMREVYKVEPKKEHYACVVDMLCRVGKLEEAYKFLKEMLPMGISDSMLGAFFNGCKIHRRRDLVEAKGEEILGMNLNRTGGLVTLSNIYAAAGEWYEVVNVRKTMRKKAAPKKPGFSWLEGEMCIVRQCESRQYS